jgi:hypothetical protein
LTLGDDVGFFPLIALALTTGLQVAQQAIARKKQKAAEAAAQRQAAEIAAQEARARATAMQKGSMIPAFMGGGPSMLGGISPIMLGLLVGVPVVAMLFLKK